jgi:membrane dipeptidase
VPANAAHPLPPGCSPEAAMAGGVAPPGSKAAPQTAETAAAALAMLRQSISVDVHTHGGTSWVSSEAPPNNDLASGMRAGSLAVACFADVPDGPGAAAGWRRCASRSRANSMRHLERLAWIDEMVAHDGLCRALTVADLEAAHAVGQPAIVAVLGERRQIHAPSCFRSI